MNNPINTLWETTHPLNLMDNFQSHSAVYPVNNIGSVLLVVWVIGLLFVGYWLNKE